jgi:hypothetical protein
MIVPLKAPSIALNLGVPRRPRISVIDPADAGVRMQRFPIVPGPMPDATRTRQIESIYGVAEPVALAETAILMGDLDKAIEQLKKVRREADVALSQIEDDQAVPVANVGGV